jgi:hypothetical protein
MHGVHKLYLTGTLSTLALDSDPTTLTPQLSLCLSSLFLPTLLLEFRYGPVGETVIFLSVSSIVDQALNSLEKP